MLRLVCHNPGTLPATIRSRCRRLTLRPLTGEMTAEVIPARRSDLSADDVATLARIAEGRPGYALALAEQGGLSLFRALRQGCETLPDLDVQPAHAIAYRFGRPAGQGPFILVRALFPGWVVGVPA